MTCRKSMRWSLKSPICLLFFLIDMWWFPSFRPQWWSNDNWCQIKKLFLRYSSLSIISFLISNGKNRILFCFLSQIAPNHAPGDIIKWIWHFGPRPKAHDHPQLTRMVLMDISRCFDMKSFPHFYLLQSLDIGENLLVSSNDHRCLLQCFRAWFAAESAMIGKAGMFPWGAVDSI